ncbi:hypothetical protein BU23DRAFT_550051 [Bimuria novae-zelandiae CBS 107.79]|uniref:Uncharacterized protein n=1 Tax=Bimuria novae-zelandiae CBS 107.79 TaxID=1447943 RepID=A0A6A5VUV2_9PLEO|nr:hypothetical protein BU23DRAFT_550051 [Bimuria novae-zelandiae CBS 107.79]
MASADRAVPLRPVTYGKATRQLIYEESICAYPPPYNRHIRRNLGFREIQSGTKGRPVFASKKVQELYNILDEMARNDLPNHSIEALKHAWLQRVFTKQCEDLTKNFGEAIWGDSLEKRRKSSNPNSQLLTMDEDEAPGDLYYLYPRHREFIALQLEHLLFVKAVYYSINQSRSARPSAAMDLKPAGTPIARKPVPKPHGFSSVTSTPKATLLVTLSLPSRKLNNIRRRNSVKSIAAKIASAGKKRDALGKFVSGEALETGVSDESEDSDDGSDNEWHPHKARRTLRRTSRNTRGYAATFEDEEDDHDHDEDAAPYDRGQAVVRRHRSVANERTQLEDEEDEIDSEPSSTSEVDDGNAADDSRSEDKMNDLQRNLAILLYEELETDDLYSHGKRYDAASLLEKSKQLDDILDYLLTKRGDSLRTKFGGRFERVEQKLKTWLGWRKGCWLLSEATKIHPFANQPIVRYTFTEWAQKLGGANQVPKVHKALLKCHRELAKAKIHGSDDIALSTAKDLACVFAELVDEPMLKDSLLKQLVVYNKHLFSWDLNLWM